MPRDDRPRRPRRAPQQEAKASRAGPRRRFSDEQLLAELQACAERLGRSPTMREFARDARTRVHPQTVVVHFGSWNRAKRLAGLVPRRFATGEELLGRLRALGDELGRTPTGRDLDDRRATMPSKSLYWHTFGSLSSALRAAGFDVPARDERLRRALDQGERLAGRLGRLPRFADWQRARRRSPRMLSEWQVYRLFAEGRGGWTTFRAALRDRLEEKGVEIEPNGRVVR
ncbi:MAG: homing endonuclease associated repeat-containing protein [Gaiellaceae bacterium]